MAMNQHEERAADRRALIQAAATLYAGGAGLTPRHAVEIALEIEAVIIEVKGAFANQRAA